MNQHVGEVKIKLVFLNPKALRALGMVVEVLEDLVEDLSWRPEVKRAAKAAKYAFKHIGMIEVRDEPPSADPDTE